MTNGSSFAHGSSGFLYVCPCVGIRTGLESRVKPSLVIKDHLLRMKTGPRITVHNQA